MYVHVSQIKDQAVLSSEENKSMFGKGMADGRLASLTIIIETANILHTHSYLLMGPTHTEGIMCVGPNVNVSDFVQMFVVVK